MSAAHETARGILDALERAPGWDRLREVADAIAGEGGRALLVGGVVRDALLGLPAKDLDLEVHGLALDRLESLLARFGRVLAVGRSFGVLRIAHLDVDISLPRRDSDTGPGHRGFSVEVDPELGYVEASRRRDLTINAMGFDPRSGELLDPHGGRADLAARRLRATDPTRFPEDPLRGLRVAQLAARFEMSPDPTLVALCAELDLSELPGERFLEEFRKLLQKGVRPSLGLAFLEDADLLRFFPELEALVGVPQDPEWHPEGDVWVHTQMVVDRAAELRTGDDASDSPLMFAALCHDFGKPATTRSEGGRIRSNAHDRDGVPPTRAFLERLRAPSRLTESVAALVRHHLDPALFEKNGASEKAYRRLARRLGESGVSMQLLERVARADHLGRTTAEALARRFPQGDRFLEIASRLEVHEEPPVDVVGGRHLIARGLVPGPEFARILEACRELQYESGLTDPHQILDRVLPREE